MKLDIRIDERKRAAQVGLGPFEAHVDLDQFSGALDESARRRLFLQSVNRVNIEIFSYCNRRCGFCPNRDGTRLVDRTILPSPTFRRIIDDLQSIGYERPLYFHLYNEPLADAAVLFDRMEYARPRLPKSTFSITTNGDYLSAQMFDRLVAAGCNRIFVSVYGPNHGKWEEAYIRDRVTTIARTLGLDSPLVAKPDEEYRIAGVSKGVDLTIAGQNLWETGYNRGGLVPELAVERSSPCLAPISDVNIDFRGFMLPCCNVYTDRPDHTSYTYGNVNAQDIFTVYASAVAQSWKRGLLKFNPGGTLCGQCSRGEYPGLDTPENRAALADLDRSFEKATV